MEEIPNKEFTKNQRNRVFNLSSLYSSFLLVFEEDKQLKQLSCCLRNPIFKSPFLLVILVLCGKTLLAMGEGEGFLSGLCEERSGTGLMSHRVSSS